MTDDADQQQQGSLPKGGQCRATFTATKTTGQKPTELITVIKLNATIILQTFLVQAPQKPAVLPSLPQHVPCH